MPTANSAGSNPPAGGSSAGETSSNPPAGASGSQGNNQISDPEAEAQHPQAGEEHISPDVARELRREAQALRKRNQELEATQKAAELAQMGELEKTQKLYSDLQERYSALEAERQNWRLADVIARHAPALGLIDPDAARILLLTGGELETDDDGNYKNVEKLLEKLVAAKPYLVASTNNGQPRANFPTSGGATNPGRSAAPAAQPAPRPNPLERYQQHKDRGGLQDPSIWKRQP